MCIRDRDTVDVKPAEILGKVILWPVALMEAVVRYSSTHHNICLLYTSMAEA